MVWLKYRAKRERGRWSREVSKKEAGVVDPRQAENSSVFLGQELWPLDCHAEYVSRGMTCSDVHFKEVALGTVRRDEKGEREMSI